MTTVVDDFEAIYHDVPCGIVSLDRLGSILAANRTFELLAGRSVADLVGTRFRDLLTPGGRIFYETRFLPVLELQGSVQEVALTMRREDAAIVPVILNAKRVTAEDGGEQVVRVAVFDSTERQDYERELLLARRAAETSERRVAAFQNATAAFASADSVSELAAALVVSAKDMFDATDAAVVLFDEPGTLRIAAGDHLLEPLLRLQAAQPADATFSSAEVLTVGSLAQAGAISPESADVLRSIRMEAVSAVPLVGGARVLGALVSFFSREKKFDDAAIALHRALARQASIVLDRIRLQHELHELAMHDQLTGLANRNLLRERLSHALAQAERARAPMALLFLDLDGFKSINDELGHRVGDSVLQTVASRINRVVREADIVGRFGGDEFLVICDHADDESARLVAARIIEAIAQPMDGLASTRSVSSSLGIAVYHPGDAEPPSGDDLVRIADAAMYESKNAGPGQVSVTRV